jgi:hypothetical protein
VSDVGIIVAVGLFFVAGIFVESRRSSGKLPDVISDAGAVSVPSGDSDSDAETTAQATAVAVATATVSIQPTPVPALPGTPNPEAVGQRVFLNVSGIENESVVDAANVTIIGSTTPDALLSINGQSVEVELDGSFTIDIDLEPGPNFIEMVSSNLQGQEASRVFSVVSVQ